MCRRRTGFHIHAAAESLANTGANTGANAGANAVADALANISFGFDFVVAKFLAGCGKLQRLSLNSAFCRAHQNWQRHGNELRRFICAGRPDLLLHRDLSE